MATKANLIIDQGTTFSTVISLAGDDGEPIDLTGYTAEADIRKHYSSSNSQSFTVTLGGQSGTITLSLSANTTSNMIAGRYVYDIELINSYNVVSRVMEGIITITPQVTR
jgi:hypothetical protein